MRLSQAARHELRPAVPTALHREWCAINAGLKPGVRISDVPMALVSKFLHDLPVASIRISVVPTALHGEWCVINTGLKPGVRISVVPMALGSKFLHDLPVAAIRISVVPMALTSMLLRGLSATSP